MSRHHQYHITNNVTPRYKCHINNVTSPSISHHKQCHVTDVTQIMSRHKQCLVTLRHNVTSQTMSYHNNVTKVTHTHNVTSQPTSLTRDRLEQHHGGRLVPVVARLQPPVHHTHNVTSCLNVTHNQCRFHVTTILHYKDTP